ncbi:MAG: hypothetical protein NXI21_17125 [Alphaproteobacteria bacterium]|nr:hypothetical protein [Alphaproteobacteria bacterium]
MTSYVRIFESEEAADAAAAKLGEAGFSRYTTLHAAALAGREDATVRSAAEEGVLPGASIRVCLRALSQGRSIVAVQASFGRGLDAINILEESGAVDSDQVPSDTVRNPSPFSDFLGIPTLTGFTPTTKLKDPHWTFSSKIGMGLLSRKATPLSSMTGMKVLTARKKSKTSSFGLPLLMRNPAPFSSLFGMKLLTTKPKGEWKFAWGLPLLAENPAPLSSLFGMKTSTRD